MGPRVLKIPRVAPDTLVTVTEQVTGVTIASKKSTFATITLVLMAAPVSHNQADFFASVPRLLRGCDAATVDRYQILA